MNTALGLEFYYSHVSGRPYLAEEEWCGEMSAEPGVALTASADRTAAEVHCSRFRRAFIDWLPLLYFCRVDSARLGESCCITVAQCGEFGTGSIGVDRWLEAMMATTHLGVATR